MQAVQPLSRLYTHVMFNEKLGKRRRENWICISHCGCSYFNFLFTFAAAGHQYYTDIYVIWYFDVQHICDEFFSKWFQIPSWRKVSQWDFSAGSAHVLRFCDSWEGTDAASQNLKYKELHRGISVLFCFFLPIQTSHILMNAESSHSTACCLRKYL